MPPVSVVIAGYARSPFHFARKGALVDIRPDDLIAAVLRGLVEKLDLDPALLEDVVMDCVYPEAGQGMDITCIASFRAGFPQSLDGAILNRSCGSSTSTVHYAAGQVLLGTGKALIAAGVESMTRVPMGGFNLSPDPVLLQDYPTVYMSMEQTAENVAEHYAVSRVEQEEMAIRSHTKAVTACETDLLREEIVTIGTPAGRIAGDGCIHPGINLESLAQLKPAFGGSITAATSLPLTDGSTTLLVCSEGFARRYELAILTRIKTMTVAGCASGIMSMGPVQVTRKVLQQAGLGTADIDLVEINEAFASQSIACIREPGLDMDRVNLDSSALAIGHPLGATGARITDRAAALLQHTGGRYAIATQCIVGSQDMATLLEVVEQSHANGKGPGGRAGPEWGTYAGGPAQDGRGYLMRS